jgi:hypothetical protein
VQPSRALQYTGPSDDGDVEVRRADGTSGPSASGDMPDTVHPDGGNRADRRAKARKGRRG